MPQITIEGVKRPAALLPKVRRAAAHVTRAFRKPLAAQLSLTGAGLALAAAGIALIYPPAALIIVGGVLFTLGLLLDLGPKAGRR